MPGCAVGVTSGCRLCSGQQPSNVGRRHTGPRQSRHQSVGQIGWQVLRQAQMLLGCGLQGGELINLILQALPNLVLLFLEQAAAGIEDIRVLIRVGIRRKRPLHHGVLLIAQPCNQIGDRIKGRDRSVACLSAAAA